jgi:Na+/melibiose symporter-like transporter
MAGGFKRSGLFGLIGVVVVAIVIAVIASTAGNEANPKGTLALIFGVIAVFVVILFVLQRSDLERVAGGDAKAVQRAVAEGEGKIENPTTMGEQQLWAALASRRSTTRRSRRALRCGMPAGRSQSASATKRAR